MRWFNENKVIVKDRVDQEVRKLLTKNGYSDIDIFVGQMYANVVKGIHINQK